MGEYERQRKGLYYYRRTPPVVSQGNAVLCWASALESWLEVTINELGEKKGSWSGDDAKAHGFDGLNWERKHLNLKNMKSLWGDQTNENESLKPDGIRVIALDIGMGGDVIKPIDLDKNYLRTKLTTFSCLYILYFSNVMYHAVVAYGIDTTTEELLVMDPAQGVGLTRRTLSFFKAPNRVNQTMFVGWAVSN